MCSSQFSCYFAVILLKGKIAVIKKLVFWSRYAKLGLMEEKYCIIVNIDFLKLPFSIKNVCHNVFVKGPNIYQK